MASIRARLTAWNGGVLVILLCIAALAAYGFLRSSLIGQVDRALEQQVRLVALTAAAQRGAPAGGEMAALVKDLGDDGVVAMQPAELPGTLVTTPVHTEEDGEPRRTPASETATSARPEIDYSDLRAKLGAPREDDAAMSVRGRRGGVRALTENIPFAGRTIRLVATQPLHPTLELLETARVAAIVALPVALVLALGIGYALARRALDPIAAMTAEAQGIGARTLHERLSVQNPGDELGRLALTFNEALARIDAAMEQQRRFTADASHELRTPIALIRAEADVALAGDGATNEEYRAALGVIRDGSAQLSRIVNDLFLLARSDAGQALVTRRPFAIGALVESVAGSLRALAGERGITIRVTADPAAMYDGDEDLIRRALVNLADNAIKYSTGPGRVDIVLAAQASGHVITVSDDGPGIASTDQPHVFERFYRGDNSRGHSESAGGAGAGLGLAIAREIAVVHGGSLSLRASDASGSVFELALPA